MAASLYSPAALSKSSAAAPASSSVVVRSSLAPLPARRNIGVSVRATRSNRQVLVKATNDDSSFDPEDILGTLKEKWDTTENKTTVVAYGAGALITVWASSTIVGAINAVPLLPKLLELVGLTYTAWFVYRYLLFKESREELVEEVNSLKSKITGTE